MIFITDPMYAELAARLFAELQNDRGFYNGKIEYDSETFYSTLTCSLVVYRSTAAQAGDAVPPVEKVVPVWWNFTTWMQGMPWTNDFSWSEFTSHFPCHD